MILTLSRTPMADLPRVYSRRVPIGQLGSRAVRGSCLFYSGSQAGAVGSVLPFKREVPNVRVERAGFTRSRLLKSHPCDHASKHAHGDRAKGLPSPAISFAVRLPIHVREPNEGCVSWVTGNVLRVTKCL